MIQTTNDLLQPALSRSKLADAPYSVGALIAAGFFGGAIAVVFLGAENARRQRRWQKDLPWLILAGVIAVLAILIPGAWLENFSASENRRAAGILSRAAGFALAGFFYFLHRKVYRTMSTVGIDAPSPYAAVIAAIVAGVATTSGVLYVFAALVRSAA